MVNNGKSQQAPCSQGASLLYSALLQIR
jgi:hypothetical protein